jgi:hypothetical protein
LEAEGSPEDAFQSGLALAVGGIGGAKGGPLAQEVGVTALRQAQGRIEGTAAGVPRRGEVVAGKADFAKDGGVGDGTTVMIGELWAARSGSGRRGSLGSAGEEEEAQQGGAEGEQLAKQGQFNDIGRLCTRFRTSDVGEHGFELLAQVLYNRL